MSVPITNFYRIVLTTSFLNPETCFDQLCCFSGQTGFSPRQYRPILERTRRFEDAIEENSMSLTDPLLDPKKSGPAPIPDVRSGQVEVEEKSGGKAELPDTHFLPEVDPPEMPADP